jgi:protein-disulfide isomerase
MPIRPRADFRCCLLAVLLAAPLGAATASAQDAATSREMILNDPAAPVAGAPKGDVTIVAFLDYNCPYCKSSAPALDKLVKADGGIRLVYKDWPILSANSVYGAKLALAAGYQGKYDAAHAALMKLKGAALPQSALVAAVKGAGVDLVRLEADAKAHDADILALLKRNNAQAKGMGFPGTPVYLIGPLLVAAPLDYDGFKDAVAQARARAKAP